MPFTLAHPAAVIPLRRLPFLAVIPLVLGSMTPDLFGFLLPYGWTRSLPNSHSMLGTVLLDLPAGYALLLVLWPLEIPLTAPLWEPHRSFIRKGFADFFASRGWWWISIPSLLIGSWTHIVWDSFTHNNRWMVRHVSFLRYELASGSAHPMEVYHVLQYLCSVLGLMAIGLWYVHSLRRSGLRGTGRKWRKYLLASLAMSSVLIGALVAAGYEREFDSIYIYRFGSVLAATAMMSFFALYIIAGLLTAAFMSVNQRSVLRTKLE